MPALPPTPAVKAEFELEVTGETRRFVNILHFAIPGGGPIPLGDLTSLATYLDAQYDLAFTDFMGTTVTHVESVFTDLTSDTAPRVITAPGTSGGSAGSLLPLNVAAVASWAISRRYRGGHPRSYLGGMVDAQVSSPIALNPTFLTNWETALNTFLTNTSSHIIGGSTHEPVNVSYFSGGAMRVSPVQDSIIGVTVHPRIDSQRRRLGKEST